MRVAVFGSYSPWVDRASSSTVGMSVLLAGLPEVERVEIAGPRGSALPELLSTNSKVELHPVWTVDSPLSLLKTVALLLSLRKRVDLYLFNIYLTSFGSGSISNGVGLLMPVAVSLASSLPVVVYMHNCLETQEAERLGYRPSLLARAFVRVAEILLSRTTDFVMPLPSQSARMKQILSGKVRSVFIPHVDAFGTVSLTEPAKSEFSPSLLESPDDPLAVLLFGAWGPQKDLFGAIRALGSLSETGLLMTVTIAGHVNPRFPGYLDGIHELCRSIPGVDFRLDLDVPDQRVRKIFRSSDVVILPYNETGGFSGVLSLADYFGVPIVAYDVPGLRETDALLGAGSRFVPPSDTPALKEALEDVRQKRDLYRSREGRAAFSTPAMKSVAAMRELVARTMSRGRHRHIPPD